MIEYLKWWSSLSGDVQGGVTFCFLIILIAGGYFVLELANIFARIVRGR